MLEHMSNEEVLVLVLTIGGFSIAIWELLKALVRTLGKK